MKKLKENVHAIQVGCQLCDGHHLDKECPHNKDAKSVEEASLKNLETQIEQLTKEVHAKTATKLPTSSVGQCKAVYDDGPINNASSNETNEIHGVSFIDVQEDDDLPSEDLGASVNIMPKSMFEHLKLANIKETNMLVEMADMTKKPSKHPLLCFVWWCRWGGCGGFRRVRESGVEGWIDRVTRSIFGFARKSRRKSFPAVVAGGGWWPAATGTEEEQAKNFHWGLRKSTLNHLMCTSFTDVAQVSSSPMVPLRATPTRSALRVDADT
nr:hypothetical protein [Tanacetum cinerariifolium]